MCIFDRWFTQYQTQKLLWYKISPRDVCRYEAATEVKPHIITIHDASRCEPLSLRQRPVTIMFYLAVMLVQRLNEMEF